MSSITTHSLDYGIAPPGYRLPEGLELGAVRLQVASLERSLEWYQRVLGVRVLERSADAALLGAHGDERVLIELRERAGARPVPRRGRIGLYHYAILLPGRAWLGRFIAHLAALGEYAGMSDHLVSEAVYLSDPDGLGIEVYADRPRSTWRHQQRQLEMATAQLDVQSLIHAGAGVPWAGLPAGTVIGHVHLYVDDLGQAEAFYHAGLGMDKVVWNYPGALFLSAGGYHHHLGTNTWAAGAPRASDEDARLLEWTVRLPAESDAAAAADSLRAAGHAVADEATGRLVRDPWGTALRIVTG